MIMKYKRTMAIVLSGILAVSTFHRLSFMSYASEDLIGTIESVNENNIEADFNENVAEYADYSEDEYESFSETNDGEFNERDTAPCDEIIAIEDEDVVDDDCENIEDLADITGDANAVFASNDGDYEYVTVSDGVQISAYRGTGGDVVIPAKLGGKTVVEIGYNAFAYCEDVTTIIIPDSVQNIWDSAFYGCTSLTSITIPDSVQKIGGSAFYGCTSLNSITLPNSLTTIYSNAFSSCTSLTSITIPSLVNTINYSAFSYCTSLESIAVDPNNTKFDSRDDCNAIIRSNGDLVVGCKSTVIPDSVTRINNCAFDGCTGLTSITIPNSVTSIHENAFRNCTSLTSITIPESVEYIEKCAFFGCIGLESMVVDDNNPKFDSREDCNAIIETENNKLIVGCKNTIIPNSVTVIGTEAFAGCKSLTSIIIPDSVRAIGIAAFNYCTNLKSINIPDSVTSISWIAFGHCESLASIEIPNSVTSIGSEAFFFCESLVSVTIPDSVIQIKESTFSACTSLISITIPNSVTSIGKDAFSGCTSLISITIPDSVTSIGEYSFEGCTSLISITIPITVASISKYAFIRCDDLKDIYYGGDEEQFSMITIDSGNRPFLNATVHYNCGTGENFIIVTKVEGNGTIMPSGNVKVNKGENQMFTFTPDDGYEVSMVTVDGKTIGDKREYSFLEVSENHIIKVEFEPSREVHIRRIRKGEIITQDDLYEDYSYYLLANKGYEEIPKYVLADMGSIIDKTNYSYWDNVLTALSYNMTHISELYKWYGEYLGLHYSEIKEYQIEDEVVKSLILAMTEADTSTASQIKMVKKGYKAVGTLSSILSAQIKDDQYYFDDDALQGIAYRLAESWDKYSKEEYYDFLKNADKYSWAKDISSEFKKLGIVISAMDCLTFYYLQEMTSQEITEKLKDNIPQGNSLYAGLDRLNAKQKYKSLSLAEAVGRFMLPFAEKWVERGIGVGEGITKASEIALSLLTGESVTVSSTTVAVARVIFWLAGELMIYAGVNDLDSVLKANLTYSNALIINLALSDYRNSLWNYGNVKKNGNIEETKETDEFLFFARDAAIKEAYKAVKKIAKGSDLDTLNKHYEEYCYFADYDIFISNCIAEAALGVDALKKVPVIKNQSGLSSSIMSAGTETDISADENEDLLITNVIEDSEEDTELFIERIYSEGQMPFAIAIPETLNNENVVGIGEKAFEGYSGIQSIFLPDTVEYIEDEGFAGCSGLFEIHLGRNTRSVKSKAFFGCTNLTSIDIPVSVEFIADDAFEGIHNLVIVGEEGSYAQTYAETCENASFSVRAKNVSEILEVNCTRDSINMDEDLEPDSISLEVKYDDGTIKTVTEGIRFSIEDRKIGNNKVDVFFGDCSSSFMINVLSNECDYSVTYMDHEQNEIAPSYQGTAMGGDNICLPYPAIEGYYVDKQTLQVDIGRVNDFVVTYSSLSELENGDVPLDDVPEHGIPEGIWATGIADTVYSGEKIIPDINVYDGNVLLVKGKDYSVTLKNNLKAYTYSDEDYNAFCDTLKNTGKRKRIGNFDPAKAPQAIIQMKGNYAETEIVYFRIEKRNISAAVVSTDNLVVQYNKKKQTPSPVLEWNGKKLKYNTDYYVKEYQQEKNNKTAFVGEIDKNTTYPLTIVGIGNYSGETTISLTISATTIEGNQVVMMSKVSVSKIPDQVLEENNDAVIDLEDLKDKNGNPYELSVIYKGKMLERGKDFDAFVFHNDAVGTAGILLKGLESSLSESATGYSFIGTKIINFTITGYPIGKVVVEGISKDGYAYEGRPVIPENLSFKYERSKNDVIDLIEGEDYSLLYMNNERAGNATFIIKGMKSFVGTKKVTYKINPFPITDDSIMINWGNTITTKYEKGGAKPAITISFKGKVLVPGTDYSLKYINNNMTYTDTSFVSSKAPTIQIQGKGCFSGTRKVNYLIQKSTLKDGVSIATTDIMASGKANNFKTSVTLIDKNGKKLVAGTDYDKNIIYSYANNISVTQKKGKRTYIIKRNIGDMIDTKDIIPQGAAIRVTVTGIGCYDGTLSSKYSVIGSGFNINKANITVAQQSFKGTGKEVTITESDIKNAVIGKTVLIYGTDYRIQNYENNTKAGTAKVTFEGIGLYGGTKTVSFKINGKPVSHFWQGVFNRLNTIMYSGKAVDLPNSVVLI